MTRNKKDNNPRMVWADDPTLHKKMDQEYMDLWEMIAVPQNHDDVIKTLKAEGLPTAGTVSQPKLKGDRKKDRKKPRHGQKTTNTHMQGLFRDFSNMKPKASADKP